MTTARDNLAADIRSLGITVIDGPPADLTEPLAQHLHNLGYRKPRTITTTEELDALPEGSVVLDRSEESFQFDGDFWRLAGFGDNYRSHEIGLPATVLHKAGA